MFARKIKKRTKDPALFIKGVFLFTHPLIFYESYSILPLCLKHTNQKREKELKLTVFSSEPNLSADERS